NPRYFLFRDKPTVLITCGEHYGALLNGAFDFDLYFRTLQRDGLNHSRIFAGPYYEDPKAFNILDNTLAPKSDDYVSPWLRNGQKYDLTKWNPAYFERLHQLVQTASERDIVLEITLFCPFYDESQWALSPMNSRNNVNGVGAVSGDKVYTLDGEAALLSVQEQFARKLAETLNGYDNFYFEICNEPYFGGVTTDWQKRITDVIVETERTLPKRHLISVNIANGTARVKDPHPSWSLFNFHYCSPPTAIAENAFLNLPIGMNETGFQGLYDEYYRREAWAFMLSGGALYNHLDYSFAVGKEDGTNIVRKPTPGGGSPALRRQIGDMKRFLEQFDFVRMRPVSPQTLLTTPAAADSVFVLADDNSQFAAFIIGRQDDIKLKLPEGDYNILILNPKTGNEIRLPLAHKGGSYTLSKPTEAALTDEIVIGIIKKN
ncbi:MAG: cellulase family glycosylhydrolase, partial [Tannerella sp.]|nr:cellulase family glycosylhydrolase [Tannerella sp.]